MRTESLEFKLVHSGEVELGKVAIIVFHFCSAHTPCLLGLN